MSILVVTANTKPDDPITVDPKTDKDTLDTDPDLDDLYLADRKYLKKSFRGRKYHLRKRKPRTKPKDTLRD